MRGESEFLAGGDEPFRRVVLVPLDGVAVVHGELMVEVVVPFTDSDEGGEDVVAGSVLVIEGGIAEPVSERVDAEGGLIKLNMKTTYQLERHFRGIRKKLIHNVRDERRPIVRLQRKRIHHGNHPSQDPQ